MSNNTVIAYPFTKSQRTRDKVMSEIMISYLVQTLSPAPHFIISTQNGELDEFIADGYYFKVTGNAKTAPTLYFYTSKEDTTDYGNSFPELYMDENGECLFDDNTDSPSSSDYDPHTVHVRNGSSQFILPMLQNLYKPYFVAAQSEAATKEANKTKIWIKADTKNPYYYSGGSPYDDSAWQPLGAVYMSTPTP